MFCGWQLSGMTHHESVVSRSIEFHLFVTQGIASNGRKSAADGPLSKWKLLETFNCLTVVFKNLRGQWRAVSLVAEEACRAETFPDRIFRLYYNSFFFVLIDKFFKVLPASMPSCFKLIYVVDTTRTHQAN